MELTEIFSLQFEAEPLVADFLPTSHPFDFWVALRNGQIYAVTPQLETHRVNDMALLPLNDALYCESGNFIVGIGGGGIRIHDFEQEDVFNPCPHFTANLYKAQLWSETTLIGCGSNEFLLKIDLATGRIDELAYVGEELTSLAIHPDQKHILYSESSGSDCRTWLLALPRNVSTVDTFQMQETTSSFNKSGTHLFQFNRYVHCSKFPSLKKQWCFSEDEGFVESRTKTDYERAYRWSNPVFPLDSSTMICGSYTGNIYCWNFHEPSLIGHVTAHTQGIVNLASSSNNQRLISCGRDGQIKLWQIDL